VLEFQIRFSIQKVVELELAMIFTQTLLIGFFICAFITMIGVLVFKEPSDNHQLTPTEALVWGLGFFLAMSVQVALVVGMG
jgi:hypothetical protein